MIKPRNIFFAVSIALNGIFIASVIFALSRPIKFSAFSFLNMEKEIGREYKAAALILNVPLEDAQASFEPPQIILKPGLAAALQYSVISGGSQLNVIGEVLYDRAVLSVKQSGFGLIIHAVAEGESAVQTFGAEGFRDLARVVVEK